MTTVRCVKLAHFAGSSRASCQPGLAHGRPATQMGGINLKEKYREIMEELEYITKHEGFIETCLDLRDSMYFYDKGLILAGYASSAEMLMSFAMFWAVLETPETAYEVFDQIATIIKNLPERLRAEDTSMDVNALIETFLQTSGWVLQQRFTVFRAMFEAYMQDSYSVEDNPDALLRQAQALVKEAPEEAAKVVGRVGAMALRGVAIRSVWLYVARPRLQMWLRGVLGAVQNFAAAAHFSFPVDAVDRERQKWRSDSGRPVIDLKAFRNVRYPMTAAGVPEVLHHGQIDDDLGNLFMPVPIEGELLRRLIDAEEEIKEFLLAVLDTEELAEEGAPGEGWALLNAVRLVNHLRYPEAVDALLRLLAKVRDNALLYTEIMGALEKRGERAVERAAGLLQEGSLKVREALALIDFLARVRPQEAYPALVQLVDRVGAWEDKLAVARSLLQTGDPRVVPHIRRLSASMSDVPYNGLVSEFLNAAAHRLRYGRRLGRKGGQGTTWQYYHRSQRGRSPQISFVPRRSHRFRVPVVCGDEGQRRGKQ